MTPESLVPQPERNGGERGKLIRLLRIRVNRSRLHHIFSQHFNSNYCSFSTSPANNIAGEVYYKDLKHYPAAKPLRDFAMPGKNSGGRQNAFDDNLYYTTQSVMPAMTTVYPMTTPTPPPQVYRTSTSPMSVSVMPKSMPVTRPYVVMTSAPHRPREESMYKSNSKISHRYERGSYHNKEGRNGIQRYDDHVTSSY